MTNTPSIHAYLEKLKRREEAATKGPWNALPHPSDDGDNWPLIMPPAPLMQIGLAQVFGEKNATFIASARSDIPKLRAIVECLLEAVENIAKDIETHSDWYGCDHPVEAQDALTRVGQMVEGRA